MCSFNHSSYHWLLVYVDRSRLDQELSYNTSKTRLTCSKPKRKSTGTFPLNVSERNSFCHTNIWFGCRQSEVWPLLVCMMMGSSFKIVSIELKCFLKLEQIKLRASDIVFFCEQKCYLFNNYHSMNFISRLQVQIKNDENRWTRVDKNWT